MGKNYPGRSALSAADRSVIETEIERLIALLDAIDVDPDLEPDADSEPDSGDDEPWLGWVTRRDSGCIVHGADGDLEC